jgi:hypothetical protein
VRELKKQIYNDVWFFYKKYITGDGSERYWEELHQEATELIAKHGNDTFARELVGTVINELARKEGES